MNLLKKSLIAPSIAVLLSCNLYAQDTYNLDSMPLKEAIKQISEDMNLPYVIDSTLIEGKRTKKLENIKNAKDALNKILQDADLEGQIKDDLIIIKKKKTKTNSRGDDLGEVNVIERADSISENSNSYTVPSMSTSTRLNLSSKETPQSVTVLTTEQIKDRNIDSITDIVASVVGLSSNQQDSERHSFSARGFDITNYQINGVSTTWRSGYNAGETQQDLTIYDRVEVVRGANGLISGAGDPSAAINLVRKRAHSKEFTGNMSLQAGSWNNYKVNADISTPLSQDGKVRARVAASYNDKDSFTDFYENKKTVVFATVEADLSDNTRLSLGASYQDNDPSASMWGALPSSFSDGSKTNWDRSKTSAPKWSYWASTNTNYFVDFEHYFKNDIKLFTSYTRTQSDADAKLLYAYGSLDKTTGLGLAGSGYLGDFDRTQDNIDIYTSVPFELGKQNHEFLAGFMYNKQDFKASSARATIASLGNYYEWDGNIAQPTFGAMSLAEDTRTKQLGGYLVGRFNLSDNLKLIAGARYTNWEKEDYNRDFTYDHNVLTPYAGIIYDINEDYTLYASYTDIFKPQDKQDSSGNFLDPIEGKAYEAGLKAEFFDDKLTASLAVFRIEQDKLAQNDPSGAFIPGSTSIASVAAEGTTSKGFELEFNGEITDKWNVNFGYAYFQAKDAQGEDVNTSFPRKTFKLFTKYKFDKLSLGTGVNWRTSAGQRGVIQDAYYLVNAMAKYEFTDNLSAQLNVNNVFDKEYYSSVGFFGKVAYGDPRNAMLTLNYKF